MSASQPATLHALPQAQLTANRAPALNSQTGDRNQLGKQKMQQKRKSILEQCLRVPQYVALLRALGLIGGKLFSPMAKVVQVSCSFAFPAFVGACFAIHYVGSLSPRFGALVHVHFLLVAVIDCSHFCSLLAALPLDSPEARRFVCARPISRKCSIVSSHALCFCGCFVA